MPGFIRSAGVLAIALIAYLDSPQKIRGDFRLPGLHGDPCKQALQIRMSYALEDPRREQDPGEKTQQKARFRRGCELMCWRGRGRG